MRLGPQDQFRYIAPGQVTNLLAADLRFERVLQQVGASDALAQSP